jgi:DNA-binding Lrp family transcriptional regulator
MHPPVEIDRIDNQILQLLLKDARMSLREIAKECGTSAVSVFNRIARLKETGVITGVKHFTRLEVYHFKIAAFVGIQADNNVSVDEIIRFLKEHTCLVEPSASIGKYDIHALLYAKDNDNLNQRVNMIKKIVGIQKVDVHIWSQIPPIDYDKLDLIPKKCDNIG